VEEEVKVVTEEEVLLEVAVIDQIEILAAIESLPGLEENEEIDNLLYIKIKNPKLKSLGFLIFVSYKKTTPPSLKQLAFYTCHSLISL
jgi:hypothetical protein